MFAPVEWMIAGRYLRTRRREGFISVIAAFSLLGIGLGVATLIIVMSVMNGFRAELLGRILGLNGHLAVLPAETRLVDYDALAGRVRGVAGVTAATPLIEGQVMAAAGDRATGMLVRGLRPEDLRQRALVAGSIVAGSLEAFGDDRIVLGARLAGRLGVGVGDRVTLISPHGRTTAFGTVPRMQAFRVAATFMVGMFEYDSGYAFMPLAAAQVYFGYPDAVGQLEVFLADAEQLRAARQAVGAVLGSGQRLHDWQEANRSYFNALQVERDVMFLILTLIIVVAAFNVISSLIMLVRDKGRDIAVLRTMGATRGAVLRVFFIAGASIGVVGTLAGTVLGLLFCAHIETVRQGLQALTGTELFAPQIYFLSRLPAKVDPGEVAAVVVMALVLSLLATAYPSWRAARLDPVDALRYE